MSCHSYCRNWLHLIWATKSRESNLTAPEVRIEISKHLNEYAQSKEIFMRTNFVWKDHVHGLIDLPSNLSVEEVVKLFKGESSHWINQNRLIPGEFHWQRGYGAFSVSHSMVEKVCRYIAKQAEHHSAKPFDEEVRAFVKAYGLVWREEGGYEKNDD